MSGQFIPPQKARELLQGGAELIDIREQDEFRRERIPGARNVPLSGIQPGAPLSKSGIVIFHCRSGTRTRNCASTLRQGVLEKFFLLDGGIEAWKGSGFAVASDRGAPLEMVRQAQITAGGLALTGAILGYVVAPALFALSAAVGAGLLLSGLTGTCAMATVLRFLPWNKASA